MTVNGQTTLNGAFTAGESATFAKGASMGGNEITNVAQATAGTSAVNLDQMTNAIDQAVADVDGTTYQAGNGIAISEGAAGVDPTISVQADTAKGIQVTESGVGIKADGNFKFDGGTLQLADELVVTDVIASGTLNVTTGNTTLGGTLSVSKLATFEAGANMNDKKITSVAKGDYSSANSTDAVNGGQLYEVKQSIKTYTDGDGITIAGDDNKISVNAGNGIAVTDDKVTVNTGKGLTFDASDNSSLTINTGAGLGFDAANDNAALKVNVGKGLTIDTTDGANDVVVNVSGSNLTFDAAKGNALALSTKLTGLDSITAADAITAGSFSTESGSITAGGIVINANQNGKITGLTGTITDDSDAVNKAYIDQFVNDEKGLAVQYNDNTKSKITLDNTDGVILTNLKADNWEAGSKSAATVGQVYAVTGDAKWSGTNYLNDDGLSLTEAAEKLDDAIGNNRYSGNGVLDTNANGTYRDITAAVSALDSKMGSLHFNVSQSLFGENYTAGTVTEALDKLSNAIGPMKFTDNNFVDNDSNLSSAIDKLDQNIGTALENVGFLEEDNKVRTKIDWGDHYAEGTTIVTAVKNLDTRVKTLEGPGMASFNALSDSGISTLSTLSTMDASAANALASMSSSKLAALSASANDLPTGDVVDGANESPESSNPTREPIDGVEFGKNDVTLDRDLIVNGDTTLNGKLNVSGDASFDKDVSVGGKLEVSGGASINGGNLEMNNNKITGVADGEISETSKDAVNGSQLYDVQQKVEANTQNINTLGGAVNKLGNRIDEVGAGAAALAALHPLDFDPDNKWDFSAGYGNYRGESAVAFGAFYRPNEDTMFSVGGTVGNDDNMVNAGVSIKIGSGSSGVTTSRVAMAKEIKAMRDVVAKQDAQIQKLTAMVNALVGIQSEPDTTTMFPDVPENHWAYEAVAAMARSGLVKGYPDGEFKGDRTMTRYEFAQIIQNAIQAGAEVDSRLVEEFKPELEYFHIAAVAKDKDGNPTIERVRAN